MTFTEAQQKIIDYVSTDESVRDDFLNEQNTLLEWYEQQRTPEQKETEIWNMAQEYYTLAVKKNDEEAISLQKTRLSIHGVDTAIFSEQLQSQVERKESPESKWLFVNYIKNNAQLTTTITWFLNEDNQGKSPEQQETLESRSEKIESLREQFSLWTLSPELQTYLETQPQIKQSLKTGLSLYFTDRLTKLNSTDMKQVYELGGLWSILSKASDLMGIFGKLTSFKNQMTSINSVVDAMDIHSANLLQADPTTQHAKIIELPAFQSPEGFYKLLIKHTPTQYKAETNLDRSSIETMFGLDGITAPDGQTIVNNLAQVYDKGTHGLMTKVLELGPKILDQRTSLQKTFGAVYEQLNRVAQAFGKKSINEALEGTRLGNVANFVCALLWFGSLKQMERKWLLKHYNENCPEELRKGMHHAILYIGTYSTRPVYQTQSSFSSLFEWLEYDEEEWPKKETVMTSLPNEQLLQDAVLSANENEDFFVHPTILQGAGITNSMDYFTQTKEWSYRVKEDQKEGYKTMISDNIEKICQTGWTPLLDPSIIIDLVKSGKTQADIASLLITWLSFPDQAINIVQSDLHKVGSYNSKVEKLVGKGAEAEAKLTSEHQTKIEGEITTLEEQLAKETDATKKLDIQKQIDAKKSELTTLQQTPITPVVISPNKENKEWEKQLPSIESTLDPEKYNKDKVQSYLEKSTKDNKKPPVDAQAFIDIAKKYKVPIELMLAQWLRESHFWTNGDRPISTKNIFNVGNVDNGDNHTMASREEGVEIYAKLINENYLQQGTVSINELLNKWFTNKEGKRYASASDYEQKIADSIQDIQKALA